MKELADKFIAFLVSLVLISVIVFFVFQILPGDPALIILGADADINQLEALRESMGLNLPLSVRYFNWVKGALTGDLGISVRYNMPVSELISNSLPITLTMGGMALVMSVAIGLVLGTLISKLGDTVWGQLLSALTQVGLAIPTFWLGIMLMLVFSVTFKLFPTTGYISYQDDFLGFAKGLFLPALALAIGNSAIIIRFFKNSVNDNMSLDYVRTALSRGCNGNRVLFTHVFRNALLPVITIIGMIAAETLSGSMIVENIFSLPGLGQLIIAAISTRDLPLVQASCLFVAFVVVSVNFIVDALYKFADPRLRVQ